MECVCKSNGSVSVWGVVCVVCVVRVCVCGGKQGSWESEESRVCAEVARVLELCVSCACVCMCVRG